MLSSGNASESEASSESMSNSVCSDVLVPRIGDAARRAALAPITFSWRGGGVDIDWGATTTPLAKPHVGLVNDVL